MIVRIVAFPPNIAKCVDDGFSISFCYIDTVALALLFGRFVFKYFIFVAICGLVTGYLLYCA